MEKPQKTIKWHQNPMKKKNKKQPGNRQNSPYVLYNHLLSGLREVQVDEIGEQCHDEHRKTDEMRKINIKKKLQSLTWPLPLFLPLCLRIVSLVFFPYRERRDDWKSELLIYSSFSALWNCLFFSFFQLIG